MGRPHDQRPLQQSVSTPMRTAQRIAAVTILAMASSVAGACGDPQIPGQGDSPKAAAPTPSPTASPYVQPSTTAADSPRSSIKASVFVQCLQQHGVKFPKHGDPVGTDARVQGAVEACAGQVPPGMVLYLRASPGDLFLQCLFSHGMRAVAGRQVIKIDTGNPVVMAAVTQCRK